MHIYEEIAQIQCKNKMRRLEGTELSTHMGLSMVPVSISQAGKFIIHGVKSKFSLHKGFTSVVESNQSSFTYSYFLKQMIDLYLTMLVITLN